MSEHSVAEVPDVLPLLTSYGIRQADLVRRLGVSKSTVSMWFSGRRPIPTDCLSDLWALAALAREALEAGRKGREALSTWIPSTHGQRLVFASLEDYERYCMVRGLALMQQHATPDPSTFVDNARTVQDIRQGYKLVWQGLGARLQRWAQRPLPLAE